MDKIVYDPGAIAQVVLPEDVSGLISEFISGFDLNLKSNPRYKIDKKLAYEVQKFPICLELDNKFYLAKNKDEYLKLLPSDFNEVIISRPFYISKKQDNLRFIINNNSYGFYFKKSDKTILFKLNTKFKSMSKLLSFYLINDDVMILDDNEYKINKIDNAVENLFNYPKEIYQGFANGLMSKNNLSILFDYNYIDCPIMFGMIYGSYIKNYLFARINKINNQNIDNLIVLYLKNLQNQSDMNFTLMIVELYNLFMSLSSSNENKFSEFSKLDVKFEKYKPYGHTIQNTFEPVKLLNYNIDNCKDIILPANMFDQNIQIKEYSIESNSEIVNAKFRVLDEISIRIQIEAFNKKLKIKYGDKEYKSDDSSLNNYENTYHFKKIGINNIPEFIDNCSKLQFNIKSSAGTSAMYSPLTIKDDYLVDSNGMNVIKISSL